MGKTSERTLRMKSEFISLHREGLSILEIAKKYDLSTPTVYSSLQEIADAAGVSRESLLERPHSEHSKFIRQQSEPLIPVNREDFYLHFEAVLKDFRELRSAIKKTVKSQEEYLDAEV